MGCKALKLLRWCYSWVRVLRLGSGRAPPCIRILCMLAEALAITVSRATEASVPALGALQELEEVKATCALLQKDREQVGLGWSVPPAHTLLGRAGGN